MPETLIKRSFSILAILTFFLLVLSGCATSTRQSGLQSFGGQKPTPSFTTLGPLSGSDSEQEEQIEQYIERSMNQCLPKLNRFARTANRDGKISRYISLTGLVAGTILVPTLTAASTANSVWIAGFGALAGATNEASTSFEDRGFSGTGAAKARKELVSQVEAQLAIALDGQNTLEARKAAALSAGIKCQLAAAISQ